MRVLASHAVEPDISAGKHQMAPGLFPVPVAPVSVTHSDDLLVQSKSNCACGGDCPSCFDSGSSAPSGQRLLAHELTQTVPRDVIARFTSGDRKSASPDAGKTPVEIGGAPDAGKDTKPPKPTQTVCLTYDDGPQKGTEDVLNAHAGKVPATFFLTGQNMASDPVTQKALVERMLNEGHQLGNHTFTHTPMTSPEYEKEYGDLSDPAKLKKFQDNYAKNEQHFRKLLGAKSPIFELARLPGNGRFVKLGGKLVYVIATEGLGLAHITWHSEFGTNGSFGHLKAQDWQGIKGVASDTNALPAANAIILLHDRHWSGHQPLVEAIIKTLSANGYVFGKISSDGKCG